MSSIKLNPSYYGSSLTSSSNIGSSSQISSNKPLMKSKHVADWEGFIAVNNENKALINQLLNQKKLDPDLDFRGTTLLATAIHRNATDIVRILLDHGANPNKKSNENDRYEPPIITATRLKHFTLVKILVNHGADLTMTNFYGEDAIYQAVVANAFEILNYFLGTTGNYMHQAQSLLPNICPIRRAILDGENYPSKRRCLLILLKHHYLCSCKISSTKTVEVYDGTGFCEANNNNTDSTNHCFNQVLHYKNRDVKRELTLWIFLAYGIQLNQLIKTHEVENDDNSFIRNASLAQSSQQQELLAQQYVHSHQLKLLNLARIKIRNIISDAGMNRKIPFANQIFSLPLPIRLIHFLLMNDFPL